jgi:hypothetical protein
MEANWARVSQSDLKTGRGAVQMAHMTSSRRSRVDEAKDGGGDAMGYIRLFYPNFVVFIVLDPRGILVF